MKIASPLPMLSVGAPSPPARSKADTERRGGSFAELLAATISGVPAQAERPTDLFESGAYGTSDPAEAHAPYPNPKIGSHGKPFAHAKLLIETALPSRGQQDRSPAFADTGPQLMWVRPPEQSIEPALATPWGLQSDPFAQRVVCFAPCDKPQDNPGPVRRQAIVLRSAIQEGNDQPGVPARRARDPQTSAIRAGEAQAAGKGMVGRWPFAGSPASQFGAKLLILEGSVRLLLKLPTIEDGERGELAAGLARLLESFGHHRHEIVIHEFARGQS